MALDKLVMPEGMVERRPIGYAENQEVETLQTGWELDHLRRIYRKAFSVFRPISVLEVGTHEGGTLRHFMEDAPSRSAFCAVTLEPRPAWIENWQMWARKRNHQLFIHDANSQEQSTADRVSLDGPYDFVFIDADHSYPGVKRDFELYAPMCKRGGLVCLHDIVHREGCGVHQLWREIQEMGYITQELVADHRSLIHGIGVIHWDGNGELP